MSLNQVELALKKCNFYVTHTSIHVPIRPFLNSICEIIKTSHVQIFFDF